MAKEAVHLLDVNVVLALLNQAQEHHTLVDRWMSTPGRQWALCAFSEAGVLRFFARPSTGSLTLVEATEMLRDLQQKPGYHYQAINADWHTLTEPFRKRLHGHNQVTDAFLLGLAVREGLVLTTFDKAILHMAGEHKRNVLVLEPQV